jgi:hypothetical protein
MAEISSLARAPGGEPRRRAPKVESGDQIEHGHQARTRRDQMVLSPARARPRVLMFITTVSPTVATDNYPLPNAGRLARREQDVTAKPLKSTDLGASGVSRRNPERLT